ncbi:DNA repair protein RAD51 homolog 3 [Thalassophryne amazonica]|uniref:DNA repair protein RAD51 homolog 3 n=1 Tax=Thalassophryne amazonica TaxID=390379 RepID=UPI0014720360|nr:DNA repair protein RAD51 homolog 3 [Thalassophryne amazonica]
MQRPVSSLCLCPDVKVKVTRAGFQSTADLLHLQPLQLSKEAGLSQQEALEVLQAVRRNVDERRSMTALELLHKEEELRSIVTFSSALDAALGGGLPVGKITEICGIPGVGKTQLCLQVAVDVQIPECFGGLGAQAVFIDTEGSFVLQRAVDLAAAAVHHCSLLAEDEEQLAAMTTFTVDTILSNLFLVRCHDYVELLAEVHLLPDFLSQHPNIRLLVIDSVAFLFRQNFDDLSQRTRLLCGLAQQLIAMATKQNIAVVITNQMTTKLQNGQSQVVPALGESWGHTSTQRLLLHWSGECRLASILKSPVHAGATVQYRLTADGFRDVDQSEELHGSTGSQSKRARLHEDHSDSAQGSVSS